MNLRLRETGRLRILDFDTECRPMHYNEYRPESQITAIAWSWIGSKTVEARMLEQDLSNEERMLDEFLAAFADADIVTGHYLARHDLPLLRDHCIRLGRDMKSVLVQDTGQIGKVKALGKSQGNLAATFGLDAQKHHMTGSAWRRANGLDSVGRAEALRRVTADVRQHKQLRAHMLENKLLAPPRRWHP